MSDRPSEPKKASSGRVGFLGRTKAMSAGGSSGWEATTIGFTLVGCIAAGAGLGYFLDQRFGTGYFTPILFLVGVGAGFREMFLVLGRISREQNQKKAEKAEQTRLAPSPIPNAAVVAEPLQRERIFKVPPPPIVGETHAEGEKTEAGKTEPESVEDLIERLLNEPKSDEPDGVK